MVIVEGMESCVCGGNELEVIDFFSFHLCLTNATHYCCGTDKNKGTKLSIIIKLKPKYKFLIFFFSFMIRE